MKLTNQQIAFIDETLVLNGLTYDDIKLEVMDHIASEIEFLMEENSLSFEESSQMVFKKWEPQLKPCFSGLIGFTNPKIMTVKCHKIVKKLFMTVIPISFLVTFLLMLVVRHSSYEVILINRQTILKSFVLVEFCLVILAWGFIFNSKQQTTYSYLIKKKSFGLIVFLLMLGIGAFPIRLNHPDAKIAFVSVFFGIFYVLITGLYLQLVYKHFQFEKKLAS
jgi:hypothetical protein